MRTTDLSGWVRNTSFAYDKYQEFGKAKLFHELYRLFNHGWTSTLTKPFFYFSPSPWSSPKWTEAVISFDIFIQRSRAREWDTAMINELHWQDIINWFDNLVNLFPNRGQTQKGWNIRLHLPFPSALTKSSSTRTHFSKSYHVELYEPIRFLLRFFIWLL